MSVRLDADGTYTVTAGDSTDTHKTLREALDAELAVVATREKSATLRDPDSGELNGAWRWLPATDVEPASVGGVRIDATAVAEMASSLNARPGPIPIDGGPTPKGMLPSTVHGTAYDSGTPANGWAHWGVVVLGPTDADAKLYLYAELIPEVARELDAGRIATGSVHFGYATLDGELPRGVELISHALTNDPAVKTLAPANSVRTDLTLAVRTGRIGAVMRARHRTQRNTMAKTTIRKQLTMRGPAIDKLAEVAALLGISIDDEMDADSWESPTSEAICAIKSLAKAEKVLEGLPAPAAKTASAKRNADGTPAAETPPAARAAVAGLADEAAKDTFITSIIASLVKAGIAKEGDDASAALAAVDAKGATPATEEPTMSDASKSRPEDRASLATLRSENAAMASRLATLETNERARTDEQWLNAEVAKRRLTLRDEDRKELLSILAESATKGRGIVESALKARHAPPLGAVMDDAESERGNALVTDLRTATDACMEEAQRAASKDAPKHVVRLQAQAIARSRFPQFFTSDDAAADV